METFDSWENLLEAEPEQIARPIQNGGLGQIKARRIKQA
jgi:endonuclease III